MTAAIDRRELRLALEAAIKAITGHELLCRQLQAFAAQIEDGVGFDDDDNSNKYPAPY